MKKTNAMRILENAGIAFESKEYEDDGEHELEHGTAAVTAAKIGVDVNQVFKTIVMRTNEKEVVVFCQNATHEINLKKARNACGAKEVSPVKPAELTALTGYIRGGCSPLGMKKQFRTFIDETCLLYDKIYISAGVRGQQIGLNPEDLIKVTGAVAVDLEL